MLPIQVASLRTISLRTSLESLALRIGILELEEGRGAANKVGNMDRLSSTWDQLAGLALIFIWPSMITLVVKGVNPLNGWL